MKLTELTRAYCEIIRQWRNEDISHLRTPFFLTKEMQGQFYDDVVCNRLLDSRFYAITNDVTFIETRREFIGIVGLVNISSENRSAEISVIIDPKRHKEGNGRKAIDLLLDKGFNELNLDNIYGECYENSKHIKFWETICEEKGVELYPLPRRKYYKGEYFDSIYFNFTRTK